MKILPKHRKLRFLATIQMYLGLTLVCLLPATIADSLRVHWVVLGMALLLILTPWTNQRTNDTKDNHLKRLPFIKALLFTIAAQAMLILLFYSLCHLITVTVPILTPVTHQPIPLFPFSLRILFWQWGIYPFGAFTLMAAALSYTAYLKQQPGDMSTLMRPLFNNHPGDVISLAADVSTKVGMALALTSSLAVVIWECVGSISHFFHLPLAGGLQLDVAIAASLMLLINKSSFWRWVLKKIIKFHLNPPLIISLFLVMVVISLLVISTFLGWFSPLFLPRLAKPMNFTTWSWPFIWGVFAGVWWLCWTPLIAGLFAFVWRGYKIRTMMVWTLLLPVAAFVLWQIYPNWQAPINNTMSFLNLMPAILGLILLIGLFLRAHYISYVWKATLPATSHYARTPQEFLYRLFQGTIIVAGVYWIGGIYMVSITYFSAVFPAAMFILTVGVAFYKALLVKEKPLQQQSPPLKKGG